MRNLIIILIASFLVITGCSQNEARDTNDNKESNLVKVNDPTPTKDTKKEMTSEQIAEHLVEITNSVPNVIDATAVVAGDYAVVGIDVDKDLERSRVGTIKYTVAESLRKDPYGANAIVIADPDTFTRLQEMGEEIQNGRPIAGVVEELAGIVGRLMPQIPSDINKEEGPTEQNEQQLPQGEEKQLDQIQEKQSKSTM